MPGRDHSGYIGAELKSVSLLWSSQSENYVFSKNGVGFCKII